MRIITEAESAGARVVALGTFDGVHRGHQELIRAGKRLAEASGSLMRVCTFDRHPLEVLRPEAAPRLLQTPEEQAEAMAACGAEELRVFPFTRETADMSPEAFLEALRAECELSAVVVGWNYTFGRKGMGTPELLKAEGAKAGFQVEVVSSVRDETGEVISSTAIREKLVQGDLEGANRMLGRPYEISGQVVSGKHQGSRIGFPTANIAADARKQLPRFGVYACTLVCEGQQWPAVVNIGTQPTLPSGKVTVEAHALGAEVNLYGRFARVRLHRFLRGERKFDSPEALAAQIQKDRETAARWLTGGEKVI